MDVGEESRKVLARWVFVDVLLQQSGFSYNMLRPDGVANSKGSEPEGLALRSCSLWPGALATCSASPVLAALVVR